MEPTFGTARIRKLRKSDYDNAVALYRELSGETHVAEGHSDKKHFAELLAHPGTCLFGAVVKQTIVSMLTLHTLPNMTYGGRPYCLIENVVTLRQFQGQGLAKQVMSAAIKDAWAANAYKIMLLTGQLAGAKGFYEKLGFSADQKFGMALRRVPPREVRV